MARDTFHQSQLPDGRFVRMRELTSLDQERAAAAANLICPGKEGLQASDNARYNRECIKLALVATTDAKPKKFDPAKMTDADWRKVVYAQLEGDGYDDLFGPKDRVLLQRLYDRIHLPESDDLENFLGEASSVVGTS